MMVIGMGARFDIAGGGGIGGVSSRGMADGG